MVDIEITDLDEIDSHLLRGRLLHSFKAIKSRTTTDQSCFKLTGWVIDKKKRPVNIVIASQGIKIYYSLNVAQSSLALRMSKKLGFTVNEHCGFSFKVEATDSFDLYLEIDRRLIPWKKARVIVSPVPSSESLQTEYALRQFKDINFMSDQLGIVGEVFGNQDGMEDSFALATDALFYFVSNQYNEISAQHVDAVNILNDVAFTLWLEVKKLTQTDAINGAIFKGDIIRLIDECKSENFALNLVEGAVANNLNLPSPFSTNRAICQESYEVDDINCMRFTDGPHCFFLLQRLSSADGLYFPAENTVIIFDVINETQVQKLKKKLLNEFASVIDYAKSENSFYGVIASHCRPYHFYYDIWPVLFELSEKPEVADHLHNIIMRVGHDFNHTESLFERVKCSALDSNAINRLALDENKFFVHVGTRFSLRDRSLYQQADQALVDNIIHSPSQIALEKIKQLDNCYPIVWIGVEGQKRCWLEQIEGYVYILMELLNKYPNLGVVFDGWTIPITPSQNDLNEVGKDQQVVNKIVKKIGSSMRFVSVVGETSRTKLAVGDRVDFFIGNFATGSMHISRLLGKPGFGHLSKRFSEVALRVAMHIHPNHHVYLLPQEHVIDDDKDIGHDWLSYSIDKAVFYRFIESKLDKVLASEKDSSVKIFIEPPYSVNAELRLHIKKASHGNLIQIFPGKKTPNKIDDIAKYNSKYLKKNIIYDAFTYHSHKKVVGSASYLVWLREPLARLYYHLSKLTKIIVNNKEDTDNILTVLNSGHKTLDNYLTRMVSDIDVPFGRCTEAMLSAAIENLRNEFIFIGIDERQSESFDLLCATMDWDRSLFPNKIPNKFILDNHIFSKAIQNAAIDRISYDLRLYQAALAIFHDRLAQLKN